MDFGSPRSRGFPTCGPGIIGRLWDLVSLAPERDPERVLQDFYRGGMGLRKFGSQ